MKKTGLELGTYVESGKKCILPLDFVTRTMAIVAIRGGGKTVAATVLAEEMCEAGLPWIAFDPTPGGVWWGLRANPDGSPGGYPIVIIGGAHADLPFDRGLAVQLAEAFARESICVVLDMHQESKTTWRSFVTDFCTRLLQLQAATPRHVFIEEAPEFVPQRGMPEQRRCKAAVDGVVRGGRNLGYGATILTQRFSTVDKDILTQCENILALRSVGKPDRKAVREWIAECVEPEPDDPQIEEFLGSLPRLPDGEGWLWSPQWLKSFDRVKVRERKTYHPGRTRSVSEKPQIVTLSDARDFVDRFRQVLAKQPKVRGKNLADRYEAAEARATKVIERVAPVAAVKVRLDEVESEATQLRGQNADLHRQLGAAKSTLTAVRQVLEPQYRAMQRLFAEIEQTDGNGTGLDRSVYEPWLTKLRHAGARKILEVLLGRGGEASRSQIGTLARISSKSSYLRDGISVLFRNGLVEKRGDMVVLKVP